ncbi:MAG: hypothetical protein JO048_04410 [Methylobacteriaceae bacterium]|nr:hypothetical protein [Methylobacteriaceae bacterium]
MQSGSKRPYRIEALRVGAGRPRLSAEPRSDGDGRAMAEVATSMRLMKRAIETARSEVAAIHPARGHDPMGRVACALDSVVLATEKATTQILTAVEDIERVASAIGDGRTGRDEAVSTILARVLTLYEACNFQDLTGQRIRKVVHALQFVEQRLDRVITAFGGIEGAEPVRVDGDELASVPALDGEPGHVSQTDVDRYFE